MVPDRRRATPILRLLPSNETRLARGQGNCQELGINGSIGQMANSDLLPSWREIPDVQLG